MEMKIFEKAHLYALFDYYRAILRYSDRRFCEIELA